MTHIKVMRILAKSDGAKVTYTSGNASVRLSGNDPISEVFSDALAELVPHVVKLLGLPPKWAEGFTVTGATFAAKQERETVVISGRKTLREGGSSFNVLTPPQFMEPASLDGSADAEGNAISDGLCVDDFLRQKLDDLREAATAYVTNCPEQRQLYLVLEPNESQKIVGGIALTQ